MVELLNKKRKHFVALTDKHTFHRNKLASPKKMRNIRAFKTELNRQTIT